MSEEPYDKSASALLVPDATYDDLRREIHLAILAEHGIVPDQGVAVGKRVLVAWAKLVEYISSRAIHCGANDVDPGPQPPDDTVVQATNGNVETSWNCGNGHLSSAAALCLINRHGIPANANIIEALADLAYEAGPLACRAVASDQVPF